jgi:hypothetical protein
MSAGEYIGHRVSQAIERVNSYCCFGTSALQESSFSDWLLQRIVQSGHGAPILSVYSEICLDRLIVGVLEGPNKT